MDKIYIRARNGKPTLKSGLNNFVQMVLNTTPSSDRVPDRHKQVEISLSDILDELFKTRIDDILLLDSKNDRHVLMSVKSIFPNRKLEEAKKV